MFILRRFEQVQECLKSYDPRQAFRVHLKQWFRQNRQMGSRDRRELSNLSYGYFRLGQWTHQIPKEELFPWLVPLFLSQRGDYIQFLTEREMLPELDEKQPYWDQFLNHFGLEPESKFPYASGVSPRVDMEAYLQSLRGQNKSWFRMKQGNRDELLRQLDLRSIPYELEGYSVQTPDHDLTTVFGESLNRFGEMQDINSTRTVLDLPLVVDQAVWDCCAASGGKSLALHDLYPGIRLHASDVRSSMRRNFSRRFAQAQEAAPNCFTCDLTQLQGLPSQISRGDKPLAVFMDAPCSGSGSWGRQPENLVYRDQDAIQSYAELQANLVKQLTPVLQPRDLLIYVTCSIYQEENEGHDGLFQELGLERLSSDYFEGSDVLYRSIWKKSIT